MKVDGVANDTKVGSVAFPYSTADTLKAFPSSSIIVGITYALFTATVTY